MAQDTVSPLQLFVVDSKYIMTSIAPKIRQRPKDGGSDKRVDVDIDIDIDINKGPQIFDLRAANEYSTSRVWNPSSLKSPRNSLE